jgi:hypothetical protein
MRLTLLIKIKNINANKFVCVSIYCMFVVLESYLYACYVTVSCWEDTDNHVEKSPNEVLYHYQESGEGRC